MMESLYESILKYHPIYFEMQLKEDSSDQEKKTKILFDSLKRLLHLIFIQLEAMLTALI